MQKSLKDRKSFKAIRNIVAAASLGLATLIPGKSNANENSQDFILPMPEILQGTEVAGYGHIDYGVENGISLRYDGSDLSMRYGSLDYTTGEDDKDFVDALLNFANSSEVTANTPLDNIFSQALQFGFIRRQELGRFKLADIYSLFRLFHGLFDENIAEGVIHGRAGLKLRGRADFQHHSRTYFNHNGYDSFFEHNIQYSAFANADASLSYRLFEGEPIALGTDYDEFINKRLDLTLDAMYEVGKLSADSYRLGIIDNGSIYGLGMVFSKLIKERGSESAQITVSSEILNILDGRLGYLNADESHYRIREGGTDTLLYLFHSGNNGILWHSMYSGLSFPEMGNKYNQSEALMDLSIRLRESRRISEKNSITSESIQDSLRLDYGILIGINEGPFQPVLSASRFHGSRFFFNFILPYVAFNVSSDIDAPQNIFITTDNSNLESLASYIRATEENTSMPVAAPYAMNESARLRAYSNLNGLVTNLSSENNILSLSEIYAIRNRFFIEAGISRSEAENMGIFLRGGVPSLMAMAGYSYGIGNDESYSSNGLMVRVAGRSDNFYYSLSARKMFFNLNGNYYYPYDLNERVRVDLLLGGNF